MSKTTGTKRPAPTMADLAAALGCPEKAAKGRMVALGYVETCSRCGGSGRYSYNAMTGDICFKCGGPGKQLPRLTWKIVDTAKARQEAGELEAYFAKNRANAAAKKAIVPALAAVDAECSEGCVRSRYNELSNTSDTHEFVNSDYFRASSMLCSIGSAAFDAKMDWQYRGVSAERSLAILEEMLGYARAVNAAAAPLVDGWIADIAARSVEPLARHAAAVAKERAEAAAKKAAADAQRAVEAEEHRVRMAESDRKWAEFKASLGS